MKDTYEELYELGEFLGNEEMMERYDEKFSKEVGKKEIGLLGKVLIGLVVYVCVHPFLQFWLFR